MNLEEMKNVDLSTIENVEEHVTNTLSLEKDDQIEYIKYAIDTYYKSEDEGDNNDGVIKFFSEEKFKTIYEVLKDTTVNEVEDDE